MPVQQGSPRTVLLAFSAVAGLFAFPATASALIRLPFNSEECAWRASHVVVVTEGDKIDGEVEVLESWKGDLKKGDRISVPELAEFALDKRRAVSYQYAKKKDGQVDWVTCSRVVLFLIKDREKDSEGKPGKVVWRSADRWDKDMEVSAAWVEKEQVYAFAQVFNPGPRELLPWDETEKQFRQKVEVVVKIQAELLKVLGQSDSTKLADGMLPLLKTDSWILRDYVIETSGEAGTTALPALRRILQDDNLVWHHDCTVRAMVKAGGAAVGPELTELLKQDLAYWKKTGPDLKEGWLNGSEEKTLRLCGRYWRTFAVLRALKETRVVGCKDTVTAFREFWCSLSRDVVTDELPKLCDEVLEELRRPGPETASRP